MNGRHSMEKRLMRTADLISSLEARLGAAQGKITTLQARHVAGKGRIEHMVNDIATLWDHQEDIGGKLQRTGDWEQEMRLLAEKIRRFMDEVRLLRTITPECLLPLPPSEEMPCGSWGVTRHEFAEAAMHNECQEAASTATSKVAKHDEAGDPTNDEAPKVMQNEKSREAAQSDKVSSSSPLFPMNTTRSRLAVRRRRRCRYPRRWPGIRCAIR